jgi:hypothetical protein
MMILDWKLVQILVYSEFIDINSWEKSYENKLTPLSFRRALIARTN